VRPLLDPNLEVDVGSILETINAHEFTRIKLCATMALSTKKSTRLFSRVLW
jgi:hypothetical protein